jgi:hypothetical protein
MSDAQLLLRRRMNLLEGFLRRRSVLRRKFIDYSKLLKETGTVGVSVRRRVERRLRWVQKSGRHGSDSSLMARS